MGKGDKKTRRGKIYNGSHGNARRHTARTTVAGKAVAKGTTRHATRRGR